MSAALKRPPARMTLPEFLQWDADDASGARWQLVDGEPVAMAPGSVAHGAMQSELARRIGNHLLAHRPNCVVVIEPGIVPRVRARENFRIPDLGVSCSQSRAGTMLADLVLLIEIMSPNNDAETRAAIWSYTTIPSVREILVLHSTRIEAELLRRIDDHWPAEPDVVTRGGTLALDSIGFSVPLEELYRTSGLV